MEYIIKKTTKLIKNNIEKIKKNIEEKNKDHLIYLYVKKYLNSQRLGNSKTKERSEVKGSTKKILKQKGTGNARKGDIKNPLFRGGGRVFGPKKRDYKIKINKNIIKKVKKIILSEKILNKKVFFITKKKQFLLKNIKTKKIIDFFLKINMNLKKKYLIITEEKNNNLILSTRNIKNIKINIKDNINYFYMLKMDYIIFWGKNLDKYILKII